MQSIKQLSQLSSIFDRFVFGKNRLLQNRIVMAPMTRSRADENDAPSDIIVQYYQQRASAGLIITEGTQPSINGKGYARTPGIHSATQISAWYKVTQAVHQSGGKIFLQLMHVGRIAHPLNKNLNARTIAPSAIKANGTIFTDQQGPQALVMPDALLISEIQEVISEYKQATINAFAAGFDGVELHAGTGYLPMQFLSSNTNQRSDKYGGSITNRIRFVIETLEAMASVKGPDKIGIRIWPGATFNDIHDINPTETYKTLLKAINPMHLAYVHVIKSPDMNMDAFKLVRDHYDGVSIINGGLNLEKAENAIYSGLADLVSFGTLFLANPDLVERFRQHAPYNQADPTTFYTSGAKGYIDYPFLENN